jgi:hypothetical protein
MTIADRQVQEDIAKLQRPDVPIRVSRLLGVDLSDVEGVDVGPQLHHRP